MRKILPLFVLILAIVGGGGYCITWFAQAAQIRRGIEQAINRINEKEPHITYESLETSGFPTDVYVSLVKPHFTGRVDQLLKALAENAPATTNPAEVARRSSLESLPEWNEDATLDGSIVVGINALSDHYSLRIIGNLQHTSKIKDQTISMASQSPGDGICTLELSRSSGMFGSLWSFHTLARDGKTFLQDFRSLDCTNPGNTTFNPATKEKLMSSGPFQLYITSAPQANDQRQVRVYAKITDSEVTAQGDGVMAAYFHAISPENSFPPLLSLYGKQNLEIDFAYTGPSEWQIGNKNPTLDVSLSKFNISNQAYSLNINFYLTNGTNGANRNARLAFKTNWSFGESYDAILRQLLQRGIQQIATSKDPKFDRVRPYVQKYTPDQVYAIVYPAVPNLHALGNMVQAIDVSYQGAPDFSAGDVNLADLELSAAPYGITGKGNAKRMAGQMIPAVNMTLACRNCLNMIDDMAAYAARLQTACSYFDPAKAATMTIEPQKVAGVKNFLAALNESPQNGTDKTAFNYAIVSDGALGITINGKRMDQIMALYQQYLASAMQPQPAAPNSVPPQQ